MSLITIADISLPASGRALSRSGIIIGVAFFLPLPADAGIAERFYQAPDRQRAAYHRADDYRNASVQPVQRLYEDRVIELRSLQPMPETRGIRGYKQVVEYLQARPGVRASATLTGQAILNYAGRDNAIVLNGMIPADMKDLTTIDENMKVGGVDDLIANRNGIIVGAELCRRLMLEVGDNITLTASTDRCAR